MGSVDLNVEIPPNVISYFENLCPPGSEFPHLKEQSYSSLFEKMNKSLTSNHFKSLRD